MPFSIPAQFENFEVFQQAVKKVTYPVPVSPPIVVLAVLILNPSPPNPVVSI
jgi:hypothetical protein